MLQLLYSLLVPFLFFFFNDTATTEIYTLSLHDALPICYPIDIISVLLVLCALSIQLSSLIYKWPWYTLIPILFLVRGVDLDEHNHAHLTVFRSGGLNSLLAWMCHLSIGVSLDQSRIQHVSYHHR